MTTGNPVRLILTFSIPLLIGNVFQQLYNLADTVIVGRTIGRSALAAVGSTGAIAFLVLGGFYGLTCGLAVVTAQRFGARDEAGVRRSIATSTLLCGAFTLALTLLSVSYARPMLKLMNTPEDIFEDAYSYIVVMFLGIGALAFYNLLSSIIRALGDSRTPLFFLIISCFLNIGLDFLFILSFGWGVAGAAWATVLSQLVSALWCLGFGMRKYRQLQLRRGDWRWSWSFAWEHLKVALPMALQFSVTAIGVVVLQGVLNSFGSIAVAAYTTGAKVEQVATAPLFSFGVAIATYAAQNYGAGKLERIEVGVRKSSRLIAGFCVVAGVVVIALGRFWAWIFVGSGEQQVIAQTHTYLVVNGSMYVVLGYLFVYRNALQGMGRTFVPLLAGGCELLVRALLTPLVAGWVGYLGVCAAGPAAWISAAIPLALAYFHTMRNQFRGVGRLPVPGNREAAG